MQTGVLISNKLELKHKLESVWARLESVYVYGCKAANNEL